MRIKEIIKERGFTLEYVGRMLGKSKSGMTQIVNNENTPPNTLRKIAEVIGCDIVDFFADECKQQAKEENVFICPKCGEKYIVKLELEPVG